jgi:hypothetical protein
MSLSRRERREYAKHLGLLSKKENYQEMVGRFKRSNEAGDYLHTHHLQEIKNSQSEPKAQKESIEDHLDPSEDINPYGFLGKR